MISRSMLENNDSTISDISDTERHIWIVYLTTVLVSTLLGNTIILIASIRYNAFKLNKFIVVIIKHMAVCDLVASIAFTFPTITSMIAHKWVLGQFCMYAERFTVHLSFPLTNVLICVLAGSKVLLLQFPLRTRAWSERSAHLVCVSCWTATVLYSAAKLVHYQNKVYFNYATYDIDYKDEETDKVFSIAIDSVYCVLIMIVMITTVFTLKYLFEAREVARRAKSAGSVRWHGILTVVLTSGVFCVSTIPWTVHRITEQFVAARPQMMLFHTKLKRAAEYLPMLGVTSNFYIYCVTVPSFRQFLISLISTVSVSIFRRVKAGEIEDRGSAAVSKTEQQRSSV